MCRNSSPPFALFAVLLALVAFLSTGGMPRHRRHQQKEATENAGGEMTDDSGDTSANCSYTDPYCYNSEAFIDAHTIDDNDRPRTTTQFAIKGPKAAHYYDGGSVGRSPAVPCPGGRGIPKRVEGGGEAQLRISTPSIATTTSSRWCSAGQRHTTTTTTASTSTTHVTRQVTPPVSPPTRQRRVNL
ncbi:hypothetical protein niasHS_014155 [Heterodera schachtii]|uniref:Uncharacterized protein n=1 Tax=Heterodera schachtii TaxID=97005 RepID=A0ABD2IKE0_HETSC